MRRLLLFKITLLAAACLLTCSSGCGIYNPRHGMLLRGDWSLEFNRVPWLNTRTQTYDEAGEGSCAPGMVVQPPAAPGSCEMSGTCPAPRALGCQSCVHPQAAAPAMAPPQQISHSRFHPVPTRPVFTPWNCATPDSGATAPVNTQPQVQPAPELIPTPAASQAARRQTRTEGTVRNAAWIFQPENSSGQALAAR